MDSVIHFPALKKRSVPSHEGLNMVIWLDSKYLIRKVSRDDEKGQLRVYLFEQDEGYRLPTAAEFTVGRRQPVSPDGSRLLWLDCEKGGHHAALRIWHLQERREERVSCSLDPQMEWGTYGAVWLNDREIIFMGRRHTEEAEKRFNLHLMHIDTTDGKAESSVSTHRFSNWYPAPDYRHALCANHGSTSVGPIYLIDLEDDTCTALEGESQLPLFTPSSESALRVVNRNGQHTLVQVCLSTGVETPLHRVLSGVNLTGISHDGRPGG